MIVSNYAAIALHFVMKAADFAASFLPAVQ